jgi:hypothetical protein
MRLYFEPVHIFQRRTAVRLYYPLRGLKCVSTSSQYPFFKDALPCVSTITHIQCKGKKCIAMRLYDPLQGLKYVSTKSKIDLFGVGFDEVLCTRSCGR